MNIAILSSGRGSNASAILKKNTEGFFSNANFKMLICDNKGAPSLEIAKSFNIESIYLDTKRAGARFSPEGTNDYIKILKDNNIDLIVLAGFMKILPPEFVSAFNNRIINLHPSLLPSFKGKDAIKQAFEYGVKVCGCTVHFVDNQLDSGKIIAQKTVEILSDDTLDSLEEKVHKAEHILLPEVIANITSAKIKIG